MTSLLLNNPTSAVAKYDINARKITVAFSSQLKTENKK